MFAGREGFEPVMPARPGSLSARGLRSIAIWQRIIDNLAEYD
jgi:hypothetical protein